GTTYSLFVQALFCFLNGSYGTDVLNVSNPAAPARIGNIAIGGVLTRLQGSLALESSADGLSVLDLANPASPGVIGQIAGVFGEVTAQGRYLYAAGGAAGLSILDMGSAF